MKISVAMATYNGEKYFQEQLESFVVQTRPPDELVVSDDGSSDGTLAILNRFAETSPFIVKIHRNDTNLGYVKNFEKAMSLCSGDIIFFSDQDDVWYPKKVESHLDIYAENKAILTVISNQDIVGARLEPSGRTSLNEYLKRRGNNKEFVHGCCTSFRRELYGLALNPAVGFAHDDWVHAIANACDARYVTSTPLQAFRRHANNTTHSKFNSFEERKRFRRSTLGIGHVAANLRRRESNSLAIRAALERDKELPTHLRAFGIKTCESDAHRYGRRASRLEQANIAALFGSISASAMRRQSMREGAADVFRIISHLRNNDGDINA